MSGESFLEKAEQQELFRQKSSVNVEVLFKSLGSAGRNPKRLAQILSTFDFVIHLLKWGEKPIANLSVFLTQYQASIDAKYHDDVKDVLVADEIKRQRAARRRAGMVQDGQNV